jgi:hypothetical protein
VRSNIPQHNDAPLMRPYRSRRESRETSTASTSQVSSDQQSDWELNCEVCLKHTRNQVRPTFSPLLSRSNRSFIRMMVSQLCAVVRVIFGNTSLATKKSTVETADPRAIGKERNFIVPAVAQSLLQMAMGRVGPFPLALHSRPRSNSDGITVDPVLSPLDKPNPLIWERLWIITKCLLPLALQTGDTRTLIRCTTDIRQAHRPPWTSIQTSPFPTTNPINEDLRRGTPNRLCTTRPITQMRTTRTHNLRIASIPFIQPIPTEQTTPPCRATIVS